MEKKTDYSQFYKKVIKEWEYLKLKFKDYPVMVSYIDKTIADLQYLFVTQKGSAPIK